MDVGLCCLPLSPSGLLELRYQERPHVDVMPWLSKGLAHKRECSIWLCHSYGLVSAELEKEERLTHSFLVWLTSVLPMFPPACNVIRALSALTGFGQAHVYSFHIVRKCICLHYCK